MKSKLNYFLAENGLLEIAKKGGISFFSRSISFLIAYVFFLYLTHFFSKETVGLFQLSSSILIISSLVVSLGFQKSIVRFASDLLNKEKYLELIRILRSFFKRILLFSCILGIIYILGANALSVHLFHDPEMEIMLRILGLFLPAYVVYWILVEFYRGVNQFRKSELLKYIVIWGLTFILSLGLSQYFEANYIPILAFCLASFLILLYAVPDVLKYLKKLRKNVVLSEESNFKFDYYLKTSYPMIVTSLSFILLIRMDIVMLGSFQEIDSGDIGVYGIAVKMGVLANFVNLALQRVAAPKISKLFWSKKMEKIKAFILKIKRLNLFLTLPLVVFIFVFADDLLYLFGKEYTDGALITRVIVLAYFINAYFGLAGIFMNMTGNQKEFMYVMVVTITINFFLNLVFIPKYGILGPALSTAICFLIWNLVVTVFIYRKYAIKMYYIPFLTK